MSQPAGAARVDVWLADPDAIDAAWAARRYGPLLDAEERDRWERLVRPADRHGFLLAHALLRLCLSRYARVAPDSWRFTRNGAEAVAGGPTDGGRPEILSPVLGSRLRFSLSHTPGLVGCAVTRREEVGFDVEDRRRRVEALALAQRFFSPSEARSLSALDDAGARRRFFELWTLKEAYVKAVGMGLCLPLDSFAFAVFPSRGRAALEPGAAPELGHPPGAWDFFMLRPTLHHAGAVAVRRRAGVEPRLRIGWALHPPPAWHGSRGSNRSG